MTNFFHRVLLSLLLTFAFPESAIIYEIIIQLYSFTTLQLYCQFAATQTRLAL